MLKKWKENKGFTLAELLIVVAIIGVLVAVSIPVFTGQLEKSREATDLANVRSAYARVRTAAITGDVGDGRVSVDSKGVYSVSVPLTQKKEDWQSASVNIAGIDKTDAERWREIPKAGGVCKVTCSGTGDTIIYWAGGSGYSYMTVVNDDVKRYEPALNAVLSTLYNELVADRLDSDANHIACILFVNGKVSQIAYYPSKDSKAKNLEKLTDEEKNEVNDEITKALEKTDYKVRTTNANYVFFDWDGNVISGLKEDGKPIGIGGQGTGGNLSFSDAGNGNKNVTTLELKNDGWQ